MLESNIIEYVTDALSDIEDSGKRKEALLSIVGTLYDKNIINFKDDEEAGYIDDLEGNLEKYKDQIDEVISNNAVVSQEREEAKTLKGLYQLTLYPIDNVTKQVFDGMKTNVSNKVKAVNGSKTADRKDRFVYIMLRELEKLDQLLNADDRQTYVAISNLLNNNKKYVTPIQLYRLAVHNPEAKPTEDQLRRQDDSVRRLAKLYIKMDLKEVLDLYPELSQLRTGGNFIFVSTWYGKNTNGTYSDYYKFEGTPLLFEYAKTIKQVIKIENTDKALLTSTLRKTAENVAIIQYIADRVTALRNNSDVKCLVSYDTIFKKAGINLNRYKTKQTAWNKKSKTKKAILTHLDYLKKESKIASYEDLQTGVEISVN